MNKFEKLLNHLKIEKKIKIGVVQANDEASINAIFNPKIEKFIEPILIGNRAEIEKLLDLKGKKAKVISAITNEECAEKGVELAKDNQIDILMKGLLPTSTFLRAIVNRATGITKDGLLHHVALNDIPSYSKLLLTTDGGMVLKPSKNEKKIMIENSLLVLNKIGVKHPKVGLLAAAETINPKVDSTIEASEIVEDMQARTDFSIAGPISLDLATSKEVAKIKGYTNPVAGETDILIGPDITTMNVLGKSLTGFSGARMAGLILGAQIPIVMVSRASDENEKLYSILLALYCSKEV